MPQTNRSAEIRNATSAASSCSARPMISGTAIAPAYITSTCCKPSVNSRGSGSISLMGCTAGDIVAEDMKVPPFFRSSRSNRVSSDGAMVQDCPERAPAPSRSL
jgi:hypothetical protein